jgi:polygalacturonase
MRTITLLLTFCLIQSLQAKNFNIIDLGATPDGVTLCTNQIQKAIDNCSASGGGTVTVPTGVFLTGTINLKNNVILYLENGAVLLGSTKIEDYKPGGIIRALDAHNIGITGNGAIDGQGHVFWSPTGKEMELHITKYAHNNPSSGNLIQLEGCKNVIVENVTLKGSEEWTLHLLACDEVLVNGIKIRNPLHGPNTDGIDIQACSNIKISNCDIYTRDDAIVIKNRHPNYYGKVCENITVTNCILATVCNGFKIGTESLNDFRNIVFSNSVIKGGKPDDELAKTIITIIDPANYDFELGPRSGIALETVDGANLYGVTITNIVMEDVRVPLFIRLANRGAGEQKVAVPAPGTLKDVIISNIVAYGSSTASSISAIPGSYVENVILKNILIKTKGGGTKELAQKEMGEEIKTYPEGIMWGPMPVSGFFVRHVKGLQMSDIKIIVGENDMRPLIKFDDVADLYIDNLQTNGTHIGDCILDFNNVKKANLLNIDFPETTKIPWLFFKGKETENIIVRTIDNIQSKSFIKTDNTVRVNAIKKIDDVN